MPIGTMRQSLRKTPIFPRRRPLMAILRTNGKLSSLLRLHSQLLAAGWPLVVVCCLLAAVTFRNGPTITFGWAPITNRPWQRVADDWIDSNDQRVLPLPPVHPDWWAVLRDPKVNNLIDIAYRQNLTLTPGWYESDASPLEPSHYRRQSLSAGSTVVWRLLPHPE